MSCRDFQHLKALLLYAGTMTSFYILKAILFAYGTSTLSQQELEIKAMKKSGFKMMCTAHDRVGFFPLLPCLSCYIELQNICVLDNFLKPVYFYQLSLIDSMIFFYYFEFKCQQLRQYIKRQ